MIRDSKLIKEKTDEWITAGLLCLVFNLSGIFIGLRSSGLSFYFCYINLIIGSILFWHAMTLNMYGTPPTEKELTKFEASERAALEKKKQNQ